MNQENQREIITRKLTQLNQRIQLLKAIKLDNSHTVTLTIFLPSFPSTNEIDFDSDQPDCENLMQLTSCFLFLHLTNLEALKDELTNQLYAIN